MHEAGTDTPDGQDVPGKMRCRFESVSFIFASRSDSFWSTPACSSLLCTSTSFSLISFSRFLIYRQTDGHATYLAYSRDPRPLGLLLFQLSLSMSQPFFELVDPLLELYDTLSAGRTISRATGHTSWRFSVCASRSDRSFCAFSCCASSLSFSWARVRADVRSSRLSVSYDWRSSTASTAACAFLSQSSEVRDTGTNRVDLQTSVLLEAFFAQREVVLSRSSLRLW